MPKFTDIPQVNYAEMNTIKDEEIVLYGSLYKRVPFVAPPPFREPYLYEKDDNVYLGMTHPLGRGGLTEVQLLLSATPHITKPPLPYIVQAQAYGIYCNNSLVTECLTFAEVMCFASEVFPDVLHEVHEMRGVNNYAMLGWVFSSRHTRRGFRNVLESRFCLERVVE
ncbi:hypothetical protein KC980_01015 [candidate division WWE3 bacterium]|uniref:Uncharacterized protein n=1 Tax=candidate division WWE3 bacterium TaxID=2053526 RepID=A0A955ECJ6_UNCKA|nr:hypothetical protein [candidate division WWE3 bacterium]